jgi:low affinity Fe/Cu permease
MESNGKAALPFYFHEYCVERVMDRFFARFANATARVAGSPAMFLACVVIVLAWAVSGPFFGFSEDWQLVINTGTTIVTFLMVFLIQNTQNRDGAALQTKLDELIRTSSANDAFMGIERLTDKELEMLHEQCERMARQSQTALEKTSEERAKRGQRTGRRNA